MASGWMFDEKAYDDDEAYNASVAACDSCGKWVIRDRELARPSNLSESEFNKLYKIMMNGFYSCPIHFPKMAKRGTHKGNGRHKGIWSGTLTMSPSDDKTEEDMITAIKKLMRQKSCPVKRYAWYLEYTEAGTPHIHFVYETESGGRIERKHFKRMWSLWDEDTRCGAGFRGGYHRECHSESEYLSYIKKDNSPVHEDCWK